jgi:RNA polymerase sigma-70 factor (ECF subfamily)
VEDEGETPEESLVTSEIQDLIQSKIDELDEEHRTAIVLRDIQGLSYQEIAQILRLKEGTVKSRIHRARLELKEKLERAGKL